MLLGDHILYSINEFNDVRESNIWKEGKKDGENFIWYAIGDDADLVYTSYGILNIVRGINDQKGYLFHEKRYLFHEKDYKTDSIINSDFCKSNFQTFGIISSGPCNNKSGNIKNVVYGIIPSLYSSDQLYRIKQTISGEKLLTKYLISICYDDNKMIHPVIKKDKCVPFVYKKGYADIGVAKDSENVFQMKLQGYIIGYTVDYDDMQISVRCEIPNDVQKAVTPEIHVNILPHKDIKNVRIHISSSDETEKYREITIPTLVAGITQVFKMILEENQKSYYKENASTISKETPSDDARIIRFFDGDKRCLFEPVIEIPSEMEGKKISLCKEEESTANYKSVITMVKQGQVGNVTYIKIAGVKYFRDNIILNYCLTISQRIEGYDINLFLQNAHYSDHPVNIVVPLNEWNNSSSINQLIEEHSDYYAYKNHFFSKPVEINLNPGQKATLTSD